MIPTLIGISIIVFVIVRFAPGRPQLQGLSSEGGQQAVDPEIKKAKEQIFGLDQPLHMQYWNMMGRLVTLDLGKSITEGRPVKELIGERIGLTVRMNLISDLLIYLISIPLGLLAAQSRFAGPVRRFLFDTSSGVGLLILYSIPGILTCYLLILVFAEGGWLSQQEGWQWLVLPIRGHHSPNSEALPLWPYLWDSFRHMVLPIIALTVTSLAFLSKLSRNSLLENLRQDYIRTARAKGLRERTVVYVHTLSNSLLAMITILAGLLPGMIGGAVIVESIFGLPGMGRLYMDAINQRDYPTVMAISMITATLTLLAMLVADILYAVVDPRIRYA
jgi:peptide/nickel transport system permease protein